MYNRVDALEQHFPPVALPLSNYRVPLSVIVPVKNDAKNLARCLAPLQNWAEEVIVVDSHSVDETVDVARRFGVTVLQFDYRDGWPKKRQSVLVTHKFRTGWVLLLDADEILLGPVKREIETAIRTDLYDGYWLQFQIRFLGRRLRFGDTALWKLALFRAGRGCYEKRLSEQDASMSDIEVHEHIVVLGKVGRLKNPVCHENVNDLHRYVTKHNEYSNWEAKVHLQGAPTEIQPSAWGTQAQRRRWLKRVFLRVPGSPLALFFYLYLFRLGILDGVPGLIYCVFRGIQIFHVKAKMYEARLK